jgi:two-component system cell cycle response regulator CtrA
MLILLVEDDSATTRSIELMLASEGFAVHSTDLGEEAIAFGKLRTYDAIVLSLGLPDISGFEALRSLRLAKVETPVLILTGLPEAEGKAEALGFGADDYLTKPCHKDELVARIRAMVRRCRSIAASTICTGSLVVHLSDKTVEVDGNRVHVTAKEYQMLELLSVRKPRAVSREQFVEHLYGGADQPDLKIIDVFIAKIGKKLANAAGGKQFVVAAGRKGYRLVDPIIP